MKAHFIGHANNRSRYSNVNHVRHAYSKYARGVLLSDSPVIGGFSVGCGGNRELGFHGVDENNDCGWETGKNRVGTLFYES